MNPSPDNDDYEDDDGYRRDLGMTPHNEDARMIQDYIRSMVQVRHNNGIDDEEMTRRMGISLETLHRFESGNYDPYMSELRMYAVAGEMVFEYSLVPIDVPPLQP